MWPGILAADLPAPFPELFQHVAVADRGAVERDAFARQRLLEAEIRHQRADDAARQRLAPPIIHRDHVEELVAVVGAALAVDHQQPVAVAVERDADVGLVREHRRLEVLDVASPRRRR